jgi:hypothetical protein
MTDDLEYLSDHTHHPLSKTQADLNKIADKFFKPASQYSTFLNEFVQGSHDLPVTKGTISGLPCVGRRDQLRPREAPSLLFFHLPDQTDEPYNQAERILAKIPGKRLLPIFGVRGNKSCFS